MTFRVYNRTTPKITITLYLNNNGTKNIIETTSTGTLLYSTSANFYIYGDSTYHHAIDIESPSGYSLPTNLITGVYVDNVLLVENTDYTLTNNDDNTVITLDFIANKTVTSTGFVNTATANLPSNVSYTFTPTYTVDSIFNINTPTEIQYNSTITYNITYTENCLPLVKLLVNGVATDIEVVNNSFSITFDFNENDSIEIQVYTRNIIVTYENENISIQPILSNVLYGSTYNFSVGKPNYIDSYELLANDNVLSIDNDSFSFTFTENCVFTENNISYYPIFEYNLSNCTINPQYEYNIGYQNNFRIDIYANTNYIFIETPVLYTAYRNSQVESINAVKVDDYHYYIVFLVGSSQYDTIHITARCNIDSNALTSNFGCTYFYKITPTKLRDVFKQRFFTGTLPSGVTETDLLQFVLACNLCYINIQTLYSDNVILGFHNTNVESDLLLENTYEISLGKFLINGFYGNILDTHNSIIYVTLPFIDIIVLDTKYINTEIEIKYKIDIISNKCIAFIYSNDNLINTYSGVIGITVPYTNAKQYNTISVVANGITNNPMLLNVPPLIRVEYKTITGKPLYNQNNYVTLSTQTDFFIANEVELSSTNMSLQEQQLIKQCLNNGVFMN